MCLALPCKVEEIFDDMSATVELMGVRKRVYLHLLDDGVKVGDYVLVHAGFAIGKIDENQAYQTLELYQKMMEEDGSYR